MTPPVTPVWFALYSISRRRVKFCCGKLKFSQPAILCRSPSQPCLEFPSRSKSFAFCAALPSCSFTDYSALYAPDVRYKILWIFVTHYGARDVTGSLALWARLRPTENPTPRTNSLWSCRPSGNQLPKSGKEFSFNFYTARRNFVSHLACLHP